MRASIYKMKKTDPMFLEEDLQDMMRMKAAWDEALKTWQEDHQR